MSVEKDSKASNQSGTSPNTRWWESYLVRYFVGFIIGSICVAFLGLQLGFKDWVAEMIAPNTYKPDWSSLVIGLALVGLGYCYLASTPITVMHAGRYSAGPLDSQSRYVWLGWAVANCLVIFAENVRGVSAQTWFLFTLICALLLLVDMYPSWYERTAKAKHAGPPEVEKILPLTKELPKQTTFPPSSGQMLSRSVIWAGLIYSSSHAVTAKYGGAAPTYVASLVIFGAPIIWIGLAQYAVLFRLLADERVNFAFYGQLFDARKRPGASDVRDTYTHLREHSNSVFIVLVEVCAAALIFSVAKMFSSGSPATVDMAKFIPLLLAGIGIWMLPTVFLWSRANAMERHFAYYPSHFLGKTEVAQNQQGSYPTGNERGS
jgi:hypothetical protein